MAEKNLKEKNNNSCVSNMLQNFILFQFMAKKIQKKKEKKIYLYQYFRP